MDKWTPLIGESHKGHRETNNEYDKHAMLIV